MCFNDTHRLLFLLICTRLGTWKVGLMRWDGHYSLDFFLQKCPRLSQTQQEISNQHSTYQSRSPFWLFFTHKSLLFLGVVCIQFSTECYNWARTPPTSIALARVGLLALAHGRLSAGKICNMYFNNSVSHENLILTKRASQHENKVHTC